MDQSISFKSFTKYNDQIEPKIKAAKIIAIQIFEEYFKRGAHNYVHLNVNANNEIYQKFGCQHNIYGGLQRKTELTERSDSQNDSYNNKQEPMFRFSESKF